MNPVDFLIIYMAVGAPFGVYYFLKDRATADAKMLWLKSSLNFFFWVPFALRLVWNKLDEKQADADRGKTAVEIERIIPVQKDIERIFIKSDFGISVYEFRETIERYVGLTTAEKNNFQSRSESVEEIYRVTPTKNVELASICLRRRNRKRLSSHQTAAREDFLQLVQRLSDFVSETTELQFSTITLTELIEDFEAGERLEKMFSEMPQTAAGAAVKMPERDLWKPEPRKPLNARPNLSLQAANTTMHWRKKD